MAPDTTNPAENRRAPRRQPALGTVCRLSQGVPHRLGLVWNLSTSGVSMLTHEPIEANSIVNAELTAGDDKQGLPIKMRVVHVRKIRTGDYFLGGQFQEPLTDAQLNPFLVS